MLGQVDWCDMCRQVTPARRLGRRKASQVPNERSQQMRVCSACMEVDMCYDGHCAVCLQSTDDDEGFLAPCGHCFHVACARQWMQRNASLDDTVTLHEGVCDRDHAHRVCTRYAACAVTLVAFEPSTPVGHRQRVVLTSDKRRTWACPMCCTPFAASPIEAEDARAARDGIARRAMVPVATERFSVSVVDDGIYGTLRCGFACWTEFVGRWVFPGTPVAAAEHCGAMIRTIRVACRDRRDVHALVCCDEGVDEAGKPRGGLRLRLELCDSCPACHAVDATPATPSRPTMSNCARGSKKKPKGGSGDGDELRRPSARTMVATRWRHASVEELCLAFGMHILNVCTEDAGKAAPADTS